MIQGENGLLVVLDGANGIPGHHDDQVDFSPVKPVEGFVLVVSDPGIDDQQVHRFPVLLDILVGDGAVGLHYKQRAQATRLVVVANSKDEQD